MFFPLFFILALKNSLNSDALVLDPLDVKYCVFSDSIGNSLFSKPLTRSSFK